MIKHPRPLIYMSGLKSEDLLAMIDFLYRGEANICKENLESFFALAEELRMKGFLTGGGEAEQEQIKKTPKSKRDPLNKDVGQAPLSKLEGEGAFDTKVAVASEKVSVGFGQKDQVNDHQK